MSLREVTPFLNTNIPGAYPFYQVIQGASGIASSGVIVIFGEADGGPSYSQTKLADEFYTPDQLNLVTQKYISGQIVDAFRALTSPSRSADIAGTATGVFVVKTNTGTKANGPIPGYGTLFDLNYGVRGNSDKYQVLSTGAEVAPSLQGGTIPSLGAALNGVNFAIRLNGGASTTVTLSGTPSNHNSIPTLVAELNSLLPSGITAAAGTATNSIALTMDADPAAWGNGWGKSFELIDITPGDLAALGLSAGLTVSSEEPSVELTVSNTKTGANETLPASADVALMIGYLGTTATLTINQSTGTLTTTVVGGSGSNLSINLKEYSTIGTLAAFIATQTGYSATVAASSTQLPTSALDSVTAIGICSTGANLEPGRIKKALNNFKQAVGKSKTVSLTATATAGLPTPMANAAFLSNGTRGATLAADIVNVVDELGRTNANILVPLFSQDASADILIGATDAASTYTISAINALVLSHCLEFSTPELKKNRIAICSHNGTFKEAVAAAQSLASFRASLCFQQVQQVNSAGVITTFQPWYAACVAAGMQTGGFHQSITNKYANVISFLDPEDFDSNDPGFVEEALNAGLLILMKDTAGNKWVSDQTTYGLDSNFVYNSIQAVYDADIIALDLAQSFQVAFVGKSLADVSAASASAFLTAKMAQYMQLKLIAPSNDAPLGFKNASIKINAPEMAVSVEIKLATAIYFIPIFFSISAVQQSA